MIRERRNRPAGNEAAPNKLTATSCPQSTVRCTQCRRPLRAHLSVVRTCGPVCLRRLQTGVSA
ncbi:DUF6011 domain-containing protein [Mycobacterium sp. PSTR-4-N]|uniref:DUF6011 domain-containing protein n=1 Tax=Mycobacterium sp. PSTR-4-N TaxID=2917745 RepID=UPI0035B17A36